MIIPKPALRSSSSANFLFRSEPGLNEPELSTIDQEKGYFRIKTYFSPSNESKANFISIPLEGCWLQNASYHVGSRVEKSVITASGDRGRGFRGWVSQFQYLVSRLFTRELSSGRFFINLEKRSLRLVEVVDFRTNFEDILKIKNLEMVLKNN